MKKTLRLLALFWASSLPGLAWAQATNGIPPAITTPDKVETRIGTLEFKDGMPSKDALVKSL